MTGSGGDVGLALPHPIAVGSYEWGAVFRQVQKPRQFTASTCAVALALQLYANKVDGRSARPSQLTLARAIASTPKTVRAGLELLENHGWIECTGGSRSGVKTYRLSVPADLAVHHPELAAKVPGLGGDPARHSTPARGMRAADPRVGPLALPVAKTGPGAAPLAVPAAVGDQDPGVGTQAPPGRAVRPTTSSVTSSLSSSTEEKPFGGSSTGDEVSPGSRDDSADTGSVPRGTPVRQFQLPRGTVLTYADGSSEFISNGSVPEEGHSTPPAPRSYVNRHHALDKARSKRECGEPLTPAERNLLAEWD